MAVRLQRRPITDAVLVAARDNQDKPIGDAEMPRGGVAGWQGDPSADGSNFVPYAVITPQAVGGGSGPLDDPQGDIILSYSVHSYGVSREQVEWVADNVRAAIGTLAKADVVQWSGTTREHRRRIQQVVDTQIGSVVRTDQTDPAVYAEADVVALWTSR